MSSTRFTGQVRCETQTLGVSRNPKGLGFQRPSSRFPPPHSGSTRTPPVHATAVLRQALNIHGPSQQRQAAVASPPTHDHRRHLCHRHRRSSPPAPSSPKPRPAHGVNALHRASPSRDPDPWGFCHGPRSAAKWRQAIAQGSRLAPSHTFASRYAPTCRSSHPRMNF